jgi:hypothetical protein
MATQRVPLVPRQTYHFYNHANGNDVLFRTDENYRYFLKQYVKHLCPVFDTFAYCLLPNHFHFLIRVKDENTVVEALSNDPKGFLKPLGSSRASDAVNSDPKGFRKPLGSLLTHTVSAHFKMPMPRRLINNMTAWGLYSSKVLVES